MPVRSTGRRTGRSSTGRHAGATVLAYAVRWNAVSRGVDGRWYRTVPGCLDEWLADRPAKVDVLVEHAGRFDDADAPSEVHAEPVGEFTDFRADEIGLLTTARYAGADLAAETVDAIRSGALDSYSVHLRVVEAVDSGEVRGGEPVIDIVRAALVEAGPTHDPADPGALIVSLDGEQLRAAISVGADPPPDDASLEEGLRYLQGVSGVRVTLDDIADRDRRIDRAAAEQLDLAGHLARQLRRTRHAADQAYRDARAPWRRRGDVARGQQLDREAAQILADLTELCYGDSEIIRGLLVQAHVPPAMSPLERMLWFAR
jgi:phage head maturation protease